MKHPPRSPQEPIITREMWRGVVIQTIVMASVMLGAYTIGLGKIPLPLLNVEPGGQMARVMAFTTLASAELAQAYTARSEHFSAFTLGLFSNKYMQYAVASFVIGLLLVVYTPPLQGVFDTVAMNLSQWAVVMPLILLPALTAEMTKYLTAKQRNGRITHVRSH